MSNYLFVMDFKSYTFRAVFSCPGQLNNLHCLSGTTNDQSLGSGASKSDPRNDRPFRKLIRKMTTMATMTKITTLTTMTTKTVTTMTTETTERERFRLRFRLRAI